MPYIPVYVDQRRDLKLHPLHWPGLLQLSPSQPFYYALWKSHGNDVFLQKNILYIFMLNLSECPWSKRNLGGPLRTVLSQKAFRVVIWLFSLHKLYTTGIFPRYSFQIISLLTFRLLWNIPSYATTHQLFLLQSSIDITVIPAHFLIM